MEGEHDQLNILVIDDDEAMRHLLVDIVTRSGHQAVPAASAEAGLETLPYWTFQVAFIDHKLPGMEGLVLGEYLRRNNADMTIALITGESDQRLLRQTKALNITFVSKPFDVRQIEQLIDDYLVGARARSEARMRKEDEDFAPPFSRFATDIAESFAMPGVSQRIEDKLATTIKRCLNDLRSVGRYTERDRVLALTGLLTARVLGVDLRKLPNGRTPFEEYDALMVQHGRRKEFDDDAG
ncbi:MAG: response regulator [Polyangiaceae bacterium]|nr:response regulator [Polyangiaceae bacterium]